MASRLADIRQFGRADMPGAGVCCNADTMASYAEKKDRAVRNDARQAARSARLRIARARLPGLKRNETNRVAVERISTGTDKTKAYPREWAAARDALAASRQGMRRYVMPIIRCAALGFAAALSGLCTVSLTLPAQAQTAIEAAQELADMLDNATMNLSGDNVVSALQDGAEAGTPIALWQLGLMYESGVGVEKDPARAFQYFSQIANDNADEPPRSRDADIVAQSFVKLGDYYLNGAPDAGISPDPALSYKYLYHAAAYFADADAQYQLFVAEQALGYPLVHSARWLKRAADKGHPAAQARLGALLVSGEEIVAQPVQGLMLLMLASNDAVGTPDEAWIRELADPILHSASGADIEAARQAASTYTVIGDE